MNKQKEKQGKGNGGTPRRLRSRVTIEGLDRAPHRAFIRATGIDDEDIARLLQAEPDPQKAAETLVESALNGGSRDNITCIVVDVEGT